MAEEGLDKKRLRMFLSSVDQEILNIQAGESQYRGGALHFESGCPALNRLDLFRNNPTRKNLDEFLALAAQDFGNDVGAAFTKWSITIHDELTAKEDKKPIVRSFDSIIKGCFYDMFKAARVSLDQGQMDLLERHSSKMAKAFKEENSREIRSQLEVLVKRLERTRSESKDDPKQQKDLRGSQQQRVTGS